MIKPLPVLLFCSVGSLLAEEAIIDLEARRQSVVTLEQHIEQRQERLQELAEDIRQLDARTEKRIDRIIAKLSEVTDSQDSKTRITRLKGKVIRGLAKTIELYGRKRATTLERERSEHATPLPGLQEDMKRIDERIEKRVDEIIALARTLPAPEDVEKYESDGGSYYWDGWYDERTRISEEWRQNRRQSVATDKERREIGQQLEASIQSLQSQHDRIQAQLDNGQLGERERAVQLAELGRVSARLDRRRGELAEIALPGGDGGAVAVDKREADALARLVEDSADDLAGDLWEVLRKYDEAVTERDQIARLQENLEARKKWLEEHGG